MDELSYLNIRLPERIQFLESCGKYDIAVEEIKEKIKKVDSEFLKRRYEYEIKRIESIPYNYPFNEDRAKEILFRKVNSFKEEEYEDLINRKKIDFVNFQGEKRFEKRFFENLFFWNEEFEGRDLEPDRKREKAKEKLHEQIEKKINGEKVETFRIRGRVSKKLTCSKYKSKKVRCWLPFPKDDIQQSDCKLITSSHREFQISDSNHPSRTIYFEETANKDLEFWVEFEYKIKEILFDTEQKPAKKNESVKINFSESLKEITPHIVFSPILKTLAAEITENEEIPLNKAKKIYDWITQNVKYSFMKEYLFYGNLPEFAIENLQGDCGVQALLFITLCRISSIPARWQSGWYANPFGPGNHDWAFFYADPYGWLPVDCSFGGARKRVNKYREFYFGNLDGYRMVSNSGFQEIFYPAERFLRSDPFDNQNGEMETESEKIHATDYETKIEILEHERID